MEEPRDRLQREARMRCPPHPCKALVTFVLLTLVLLTFVLLTLVLLTLAQLFIHHISNYCNVQFLLLVIKKLEANILKRKSVPSHPCKAS